MPRKPKSRPAPDEPMEQIPPKLLSRATHNKHVHVAEIYGDVVTVGLRPWARRCVLAGAR